MSRDQITAGALGEYRSFSELLRGLDETQWRKDTRCDGWTVGHVAGHVVGQFDDVVNFRLDGLGQPEATQRQAAAGATSNGAEIADRLDELIPGAETLMSSFDDDAWASELPPTGNTLGEGVLALWEDTWVHADDIRSALGQDPVRTDGVRATIHRAAHELPGLGFAPATFVVDGERIDVGGGGAEVQADAYDLAMVVTGRADPASVGLDETANMYR
jgi:uncharacterized protein (TIGR03083 family)